MERGDYCSFSIAFSFLIFYFFLNNKLPQEHNKKVKKLSVLILLLCFFSTFFSSCVGVPIVAFLKDATAAGSDQHTVNISFVEDKEFEEKFYDILIKSDKSNLEINYHNEFEDEITLNLGDEDLWHSLTTLECNAKQQIDCEDFTAYKERVNKTLIFNSEEKCQIFLKVVSGDKVPNASEKGFILVNQVDVSKVFKKEID